ncbi:MAG: putative toxin-antitoxin system toxin component, PIN family [Clostridiales bacterium]|nr:putative toxin-antitoxin system toxin component, PIN family [Clostridiales bacterium]
MRAVFDTNVLVSAFAAEGLCVRLLIRANRREFDLFISPTIAKEFESALTRKVSLSPEETREALLLLGEAARTCDPAKRNIRVIGVCRDEADHAVLEAALACRAEFIVTGDKDLLELKEFRRIKIMTPRELELMFE